MNNSSEIRVSVVICSYNPRADYLSRTLSALSKQRFSLNKWELLIVDNRSDTPISQRFDVGWHPNARHITETTVGLTAARLRGFGEARGDIIIFVDDDNLLAPDYLEVALKLASGYPRIGVFSANISPEFETPPSPWATPFLPFLALTKITRDLWSNENSSSCMPVGAGMVVRRQVMLQYREELANNTERARLDRCGDSLLAGGDTDIGYTAIRLGFGCGSFVDLKLVHLIPKARIQKAYLMRIVTDVTASHEYLAFCEGVRTPSMRRKIIELIWVLLGIVIKSLSSKVAFRASIARGRWSGWKMGRL